MIIALSNFNLKIAGMTGVARQVMGIKKEGRHGVDQQGTGWQINIDGCCGEMAVAKHLGIYWDGAMGDFKAKDVGSYQVRASSLKHGRGKLILHEDDPDDDVFILALTHELPNVELKGWIRAKEGKHQDYWDFEKPRPAYFVPHDALYGMETLPGEV